MTMVGVHLGIFRLQRHDGFDVAVVAAKDRAEARRLAADDLGRFCEEIHSAWLDAHCEDIGFADPHLPPGVIVSTQRSRLGAEKRPSWPQ